MVHELESLCHNVVDPVASNDVAAKLVRHGVQSHGDAGAHGAQAACLDEGVADVPAERRCLRAGLSSAKAHNADLPSDLDALVVGWKYHLGGVQLDSSAALAVVGQRLEIVLGERNELQQDAQKLRKELDMLHDQVSLELPGACVLDVMLSLVAAFDAKSAMLTYTHKSANSCVTAVASCINCALHHHQP